MTGLEYMERARAAARHGTCARRKVGAVLVFGDAPARFAFNTAPRGTEPCTHERFDRPELDPCLVRLGDRWSCIRVVHAEAALVASAARSGTSTEGAVLYTTTHPCLACARILVPAGIREVVYAEGFHEDEAAGSVLRAAGIVLRRVP